MFAYMSLLVTQGFFTTIFMNFLIVGHTHTRCDQVYSVLSKRISSFYYIGTPLAMKLILSTAHKELSKRPLLYKSIDVKTLVKIQYLFKML